MTNNRPSRCIGRRRSVRPVRLGNTFGVGSLALGGFSPHNTLNVGQSFTSAVDKLAAHVYSAIVYLCIVNLCEGLCTVMKSRPARFISSS